MSQLGTSRVRTRRRAAWIGALVIWSVAAPMVRGDESLQVAVSTCGISETAMAAACVSAAEVHAAFASVRGSPELDELLGARAAARSAEQSLITVKAAQDPLDADGASAISDAEASVRCTRASLDAAVEALTTLLLSPLSEPQQLRLRAWRAAPAGLPPALRVKAWTMEERQSLLAALLDERLEQTQGGERNANSAALLKAVRASPELVEAQQCLSDAAGVIAAFRAEVSAP